MRVCRCLCAALLALQLAARAEAGIAGFNAWLVHTFPSSIHPLASRAHTDHLLIDMNSVLYKVPPTLAALAALAALAGCKSDCVIVGLCGIVWDCVGLC